MDKRNIVFQKLGGKYQLVLDSPEDLQNITLIDEAHWIATSAPCETFTCDPVFLKYLDTDKNGRIRTGEVKDAQAWLFKVLADKSKLSEKSDSFQLSSLDISNPDGEAIKDSALLVLNNLGVDSKDEITLAQIRNRRDIVAAASCNGDGVIPPDMTDDEETKKLIGDIIACFGGVNDAGGKQGISAELVDKFVKSSEEYLGWLKKGKLTRGHHKTSVLVWGNDTAKAFDSISAVEKKVDEFFSLCAMLRLDPGIEQTLKMDEGKLKEFDFTDKVKLDAAISAKPVAPPNTDEILSIDENINPAFRGSMKNFSSVVLTRFKENGDASKLTLDEWRSLKKLFTEFSGWYNEKKGAEVEKIGEERLEKYLNGKELEKLRKLIDEDKAVADEIKQLDNVEKLILYQKYFIEFVNNFISFNRLFNPHAVSMIQVGTLVMDERRFDLTVKVKDRAAHKKIALQSSICVMYVAIKTKKGDAEEKMDVAVAVTSGYVTNLYIGKKGVFFTPDGREWDAEIVDFIQQPVSVSEALRMPFKKIGEFVSKQADKFSSSRYKDFESGVGKGLDNAEKSLLKQPKAKAASSGNFWTNGSMVMLGGGVGLAALGSAFAFVVKTLKSVSVLNVLGVIVGIILIVAIPVVVVAVVKLRRRNVGMFLEACGWSINSRMRLSCRMGMIFTYTPALPDEAVKKRKDLTRFLAKQVSRKKTHWLVWTFSVILVILFFFLIGSFIYSSWVGKCFSTEFVSVAPAQK